MSCFPFLSSAAEVARVFPPCAPSEIRKFLSVMFDKNQFTTEVCWYHPGADNIIP